MIGSVGLVVVIIGLILGLIKNVIKGTFKLAIFGCIAALAYGIYTGAIQIPA